MSLMNLGDLLCLLEKVSWLLGIISDALLILLCGPLTVNVLCSFPKYNNSDLYIVSRCVCVFFLRSQSSLIFWLSLAYHMALSEIIAFFFLN